MRTFCLSFPCFRTQYVVTPNPALYSLQHTAADPWGHFGESAPPCILDGSHNLSNRFLVIVHLNPNIEYNTGMTCTTRLHKNNSRTSILWTNSFLRPIFPLFLCKMMLDFMSFFDYGRYLRTCKLLVKEGSKAIQNIATMKLSLFSFFLDWSSCAYS